MPCRERRRRLDSTVSSVTSLITWSRMSPVWMIASTSRVIAISRIRSSAPRVETSSLHGTVLPLPVSSRFSYPKWVSLIKRTVVSAAGDDCVPASALALWTRSRSRSTSAPDPGRSATGSAGNSARSEIESSMESAETFTGRTISDSGATGSLPPSGTYSRSPGLGSRTVIAENSVIRFPLPFVCT